MAIMNMEEIKEEVDTLFLKHQINWKYTDNSRFAVALDAGPAINKGNVEISLEGISINFVVGDIKRYKTYTAGSLKRYNYFGINTTGKVGKNSPGLSLQGDVARDHNYKLERVELVGLTADILSWLTLDVNGDWLSVGEVIERMKWWEEKDLVLLVKDITELYNSFINDGNRNKNREIRGEEIRSNQEFQMQLGGLCRKILLKGELRSILSISANNAGMQKLMNKFEEIINLMEEAISLREYYQEISPFYIDKNNNRENGKKMQEHARKELENIKEKFKKVKEDYKKLEEMKGQVSSIEEYEKALKNFEKSSKECLKDLKHLEYAYGFEGPLGRMTRGKDDLRFVRHNGLGARLENEYNEYVAFTNGFDGVQAILTKEEIKKEEEERAPYIKTLKKNKDFYTKSLKWLIAGNIVQWEGIKNKKGFDWGKVEDKLASSEDVLKTRDSLFTTMYLKGTSFEGCSPEELEEYKKFIAYIGKIREIKVQIENTIKKSESEQIQELLSCSNRTIKASLYDTYMARLYANEVKNISTEVDKANVFDKALNKTVSGSGFFKNLLNPISPFYNIHSLYKGYLGYTLSKDVAEKMVVVMQDAYMAMGGLSAEENEIEAIQKKMEEVEESIGYYSDEFTEDTTNSRFNAMNSR